MPEISLVGKFCCLLNLPAPTMEWSAFFFGLSLTPVCWDQFVNPQGHSEEGQPGWPIGVEGRGGAQGISGSLRV